MSRKNASVEGGFSVNSDMLVENMHEESLVAQRIYSLRLNASSWRTQCYLYQQVHDAVCLPLTRSLYGSILACKRQAQLEQNTKMSEKKRIADATKALEAK